MAANYDKIARVYDLLSRMVFGRHIEQAQVCMLDHVPSGSSILIVGGGTGWILEKLSEEHPQGLQIDYVEVSGQMIALSQKRNYEKNKVNFINVPIEEFISNKSYDVIITPFVLDNFSADKVGSIFEKLDGRLKVNGKWLYADFVYDKVKSTLWQKLLLKVMYFFFRITSGIETQELVSMDKYFAGSYEIQFEAAHYFKFIRSAVYRKLG
jgi:ubiquinone/menaquinone biosynthesis C-methylase UbiE